jgi:hypothetical protein
MVTHKAVSIPNKYDGYTTGTLCGRFSEQPSNDGFNSDEVPTCKFCLKIMENKNHWRNKKYLSE